MTRVAHLLSHYPHPSHSFLRDEVIGLRAAGLEVETIALNPAADAHVLTELDRSEQAATRYVKARPARAALVLAAAATRHPVRMARFVAWAGAQGGPDPTIMAKRAAQALEAVVVREWCRRVGVDHVHAHFGGAPGTVAWFVSELSRRLDDDPPLSWSLTVHGPHDFMNERAANLPALVAHADLVVAISDFTAAQLYRLAPPSRRERVRVARCGIDLSVFTPRDRSVDRDGDEAGPLRVVTIGRLAPEKGQWVLVDAVAELVRRGIDVTVRVVGDGELRDDLLAQIRRLDLTDRVVLVGVLEPTAVRDEIAQADVFCLPSFAEGLPIALMEAAAVGTPIVCTSVAGIPELVVDGRTGRCVPAGSTADLAAAIEQLATDARLRAELAKGARAAVEARHDRRSTSQHLASLLGSVATAGTGSTS